jgi:hypothetical protein
LKDPKGDLNDPDNWFAGCIGGSPGTAFINCEVIDGINQPQILKSFFSAYPLPANDYINVVFDLVTSTNNCSLKIFNVFGSEIKSLKLGTFEAGSYEIYIDLSDIPEGLLLLQLQTENAKENLKIVHIK